MPTGVIINSLSIVLGGIFGALLGHKLSHRLKTEITLIFGICAMAMGINAIGLMENMPAVIFSIIIGTIVGLSLHFSDWINKGAILMQKPIAKIFKNNGSDLIAIPQFVIFFILFLSAKFIFPLTTPAMINDFKACGGFLMIATGFRMIKVKEFPIADMIPAMVIVMPISWLWVNYIMTVI